MGNERSKPHQGVSHTNRQGAAGENRALQLINALDPTGGFTPEQTLTLWRAYDTTGSGKLQQNEALKFFKAIVTRMKALGQLPPDVDDNAAAARLYAAMDSDGDGFIAWAEWAKLSDGHWAKIMEAVASAKEAVSPTRNLYPQLPNQGAAGYYTQAGAAEAPRTQPQPAGRLRRLQYGRCENVKVSTASEAATSGDSSVGDLFLPPPPQEVSACMTNYDCAAEKALLKSARFRSD